MKVSDLFRISDTKGFGMMVCTIGSIPIRRRDTQLAKNDAGNMDGSDAAALRDDEWLGILELDAHPLNDAATLSDALAFVDECGLVSLEDLGIGTQPGDGDGLVGLKAKGSEDDETSSSSATPPPSNVPPVKVKKPSGQRQKEELEYLRSTVAELERQLTSLKQKNEPTAVALVTPMANMWEDIATRQSEQRQRAEVENTKLRVLVEEQLRVAKSFERLLKKRSMTEFLESTVAHTHRKRLNTSRDDSKSNFQELSEALDSMTPELDAVMASDRFNASVLPYRDMQVRADEFLNTTVEAIDMRVAPFELHELSQATWQQMAYHKHENTQIVHTDHIDMGDNQYSRDFLVTLDTPRIKATFRGNIVARRIVEEDRVMLMWTSTMKPTDPSSELEGMRQKAYAVLSRVPDSAGQELTLTKTFIVFEPIDSDDPRHKRTVGALTKFVMSTVSIHMEEARQQVENVLLARKSGTSAATSHAT